MSSFFHDARRWLPGTLVSLALVAVILYFVDLRAVVAAMRSADYLLLLFVLAGSIIWLIIRGIVWRILLREQVSYKDAFLTLSEGYLLNNFLPFRLGEIGRAFLLSRKTGLAFMEILPTIVIERVFDLAISAIILICAVPFVVGASGAERIGFVVGGGVVVGLVILYITVHNREHVREMFQNLTARWPGFQHFGNNLLGSFFTGLGVLTEGRLFARFFCWMVLDWLIAVFQYYLIIAAFFPQAKLVWGMFGLGAAAFGGAVPSLPGAIGTFEGAFGGALTLLTGDQSTSLAVALTARLYNYLVSGVIGAYALSIEGESLSSIYKQLVKFRSTQGRTDPD